MTYTAEYKLPGQWFWRTVKRVKGDTVEGPTRVIILLDESQIHLPIHAAVKYSKERFLAKKKAMEHQAGQAIPTNDTYGQK